MSEIEMIVNILNTNEEEAKENKELFNKSNLYVINLLSSPGSGKTSLLEKIIDEIKNKVNMGVIEGDIYTTKDAERIEAKGVDAVQINTEGACHLDAKTIREAVLKMNLKELELLVVENIGNMVCPAEFQIGEDMKICVLSVTEGNDKPLKYPLIFEKSSAVVLNKLDLLEHTNFNLEEFYLDIKNVNPSIRVFETSCKTGEGIEELSSWILKNMEKKRS